MKNRIKNTFNKLKEKNQAALITFLTAGDPNLDTCLKIINQLPKAGVDIIELGMAFSDPMADGPVIQKSYKRSLKNGNTINDIFNLVGSFRKNNSLTPIVLMGYFNPIYKYGVKKFIRDAENKGIDGVLIVDLPPDTDQEIEKNFLNSQLDFIKLATPTTNITRLKSIMQKASGFLYYVSITGITGAKIDNFSKIERSYNKLRKNIKLPFVVGFGINTIEKARKVSKYSDGVVIGSVLVKEIEENLKKDSKILQNIIKLVKNYSKHIKLSRLDDK